MMSTAESVALSLSFLALIWLVGFMFSPDDVTGPAEAFQPRKNWLRYLIAVMGAVLGTMGFRAITGEAVQLSTQDLPIITAVVAAASPGAARTFRAIRQRLRGNGGHSAD